MAIVACRSSAPQNAYKYPERLRKSAVSASFPPPFFGLWLSDGSVVTLELRRSLAIESTKLNRHLAEQAENEAVHQNNPLTRSTLASLAIADHMDRLVAGDRTPSSPKRAK